jgi:hypothetical protein
MTLTATQAMRQRLGLEPVPVAVPVPVQAIIICPYCPKSFKTLQAFNMHYKACHHRARLLCLHCGDRFKMLDELYEHGLVVHQIVFPKRTLAPSPPPPPPKPPKPPKQTPPPLTPRPHRLVCRSDLVSQSELAAHFPAVFSRPDVPLATGIHREIMARLACNRKHLKILHHWTHSAAYLEAIANGIARRNLDGSIDSEPTAAERASAMEKIQAMTCQEAAGTQEADRPL